MIAFILIVVILGAIIFGVVKFVEYKMTENPYTAESNKDGNTKLLSRSANNGDITVTSDIDLSNLGNKVTITPQSDISGLTVSIMYYDKDMNVLTSTTRYIGNVTKGVQTSFTISILDLGFKDAWNTKYTSVGVTGGTVSYFS